MSGPWTLYCGGVARETAATRGRLQGKRGRFWIRNARGRRIEIRNRRTGEAWKYEPRGGWFKVQEPRRKQGSG